MQVCFAVLFRFTETSAVRMYQNGFPAEQSRCGHSENRERLCKIGKVAMQSRQGTAAFMNGMGKNNFSYIPFAISGRFDMRLNSQRPLFRRKITKGHPSRDESKVANRFKIISSFARLILC